MPSMKMKKAEIISLYQNVIGVASRAALAGTLGQTFGGARDIYEIFGWKKSLTFQDYFEMYDRNGIAGAVVDALADESWRIPPILKDGAIRGDEDNVKQHTPFLQGWNKIIEDFDLMALFNEVDSSLGYGRYAIMLLGTPQKDGAYDQPLKKISRLAYVSVFDEGQATIASTDGNTASPRYGLPTSYSVQMEDGGQSLSVHYTRVIHFKGRMGRSRVYGNPRLKRAYNNLQDLEKVVGASSEAFWLLIRKGLLLSARDNKDFPAAGTVEYQTLQTEIDEFEHQLRRVMRVKGVDVTDLGSQVVDGKQQHDLLLTDIAGTARMPQRVLVGSERGELASTQDDSNWASVVTSRQKKECTKWVKDTANAFVALGVVPPPNGRISVEWQSLFTMTDVEKADVSAKHTSSIKEMTGGVPENYIDVLDFLQKNYPQYKFTAPTPEQLAETEPPLETPTEESGGSGGGLAGEQETQLLETPG
jgi:hypothetical protein